MTTHGGTTARGYGSTHQRARRAALKALIDGTPCHLCRQPMYRGQALDLDHQPGKQRYNGLTHSTCNRSEGARRGNKARGHHPTPTPTRHSRRW